MIEEELPPLHDIVEIATSLGLDSMAAIVFETAKDKGFWPERYYEEKHRRAVVATEASNYFEVTDEAIGSKLALIHSEVTEVLEAVRKEQGKTAIVEEMADIIIRTLDLYAALRNTGQVDDSLDDVVELKMKKNTLRPRKHGNRF